MAPSFSLAISGLSFQEGEDAGETALPEADGGDGELAYGLTPSLPNGLSFDAATRTISGTPAEAGEFSMTYTAADEDGDEASFSFTITVAPALQTAKQTKTGPDAPGNLTVVRVTSTTAMTPALDVTWTTPADNGYTITKYNLYYGTDKDNMTRLSPGASATSVRLTGLNAGTTYHVRVLAFAGNHGQHGTAGDRADTSAKTNTPPKITTTYIAEQDIEWRDTIVDPNPMSDFFSDADSDTLTYSISSQYPGIVNAWLDGDPGLYFAVRADNPASSSITYGASDGYGGYASRTVKLTGVANPTLTVMENSPAGTLVGNPVAGTPYGEALSHSLHGEAATYFDINRLTGQISVKQGTTLDYETKTSYTGQVRWSVQNQLAVAKLTISVTDEEAGKPGTPTVTRTEFSEPTDPALDVAWTAAAANGLTITGYEAQYRVKVADGETANAWTDYTIDDGNGGQTKTLPASTRSFNLPNLAAGATYEAQVRAVTSEEADGPWSEIGEGTANTPPNTTSYFLVNFTLNWGSSASAHRSMSDYFGDADGDTLTWAVSSKFPGVINVLLGGDPAYLRSTAVNPGTSTVTYGAHDGYGGYVSRTVDYTSVANEVRSVPENSPAGTSVGRAVQGVPYNGAALTHTLTGEAANSFVIDAATGQISVKTGATHDYETKDSYTGTVGWTIQEQAVVANLTINVTDVEATLAAVPTVTRTAFSEPTDPALDVAWTAAAANGLTITGYEAQYRVKVADGETANAWTDYTVDDGNGGQTKTLPATTRSFNLPGLTAGDTYEVQVRADTSEEDEGPWSDIGEGTANRPPNKGNVFMIDQPVPWGRTLVSNASTYFPDDPDGDTLKYVAISTYPGIIWARVEGVEGFRTTGVNPAQAPVTYGAVDGYGGYTHSTVIITSVANETRSIAENSAAGTAVGRTVVGAPYDDGDDQTDDALTHTLTGDATSAFVIDAATGQISVKQGATLDHETKDSYTGKVNWTVQGQAAVANLTINVTDVEAGKPGTPTLSRTEFTEKTDPALDVKWTAADTNGLTMRDHRTQYRKKAAEGETPAAWIEGTASATATSLTLTNLELGATYEFRVRARSIEESGGPWSDIGEGTANTPPNVVGAALADSNIAVGSTDSNGIAAQFADADSDTLAYTASSQYPGIMSPVINGSDLEVTAVNPANSTVTYGVSDGYGGYVSRTFTATGTANEARSVAENSAAGTAVGSPVTGTPYNSETLTHTMTGEAVTSGTFVIDAATGQISVKQGATLDYETKSSYTGKVTWTVQGQAALANVTITVTDVEAGAPDAPTVTRTQFSEPTDPALDVTWTAAAANGTTITGYEVQYRVKVADGETANAWTLYTYDDPDNPGTQISLLPATDTSINLPDLTPGVTYEAQVRADSSEEDEGPWSDIGEGRANRPPQDRIHTIDGGNYIFYPQDGEWPVEKTYASNTIDHYFADPDGDTLTWGVWSDHPGILSVWVGDKNGTLRLKHWIYNPATSEFGYGAHDGYGGYFAHTRSMTGTRTETRSINENAGAGTGTGGSIAAKGPHKSDARGTYVLTGDLADAFVITPNSAHIRVANGVTLDYETKNSYTGTVTYTVQDLTATASVTINVNDLEAGKPGTPTVTRTQFSEESNPALDVVWTAAAANGTTITSYEAQYRVKVAEGETANAWTDYTIDDGNGSQTKTLPASTRSFNLPNLTPGDTYEVQVRAVTSEEGEGPWSDIGQGTANTPPAASGTGLADDTINVGVATDYAINDKFTDADGDTLTYSASAQYPGVLTTAITGVSSDTLTATAVNPAASVVTYGVSDGYGGYASRTVTITGQSSVTRSIAENSAVGTAVGDPVTGTPYNSETLSYSLTGGAADAFMIDAATGQISVKTGATLDYETTSSYTGAVGYTVQSQSASVSLTINVTDLEAALAAAPTVTRTAFSEPTDPALDVAWTAAAANGLTITGYEVQYRVKVADGETANAWTLYDYEDPNNAGSQISLLSATTTSINLPDLTAGAIYEAQVRALTSEEGEGPWSDTGEGTANRPPNTVGAVLADTSIAVGATDGNGIVAQFADADGDTLTYSASSQYPGIMSSVINGSNLEMTAVNPAASTVTYGASDPYGGYVSRTFTATGTQSETWNVIENSVAGTAVGDPVTGVPHSGETLSYSLAGDAADAFAIDSSIGQISVKQGAALDYETKDSYTGQVNWTVQGQAAAVSLNINVMDGTAPGKPATPSLTRTQFSEPSSPALDVTWTAPTGDGFVITGYEAQYRKKVAEGETANAWTLYKYDAPDNPGSKISELSATTTNINLPDLEAGAKYEAQVRVLSSEGNSPWSDIGAGQANEPPSAGPISDQTGTVGSSGTLSAEDYFIDPENDSLTYTVTSEHPSLIQAVNVQGDTVTWRYLNTGPWQITVAAHDGYGGSFDESFTATGIPAPTPILPSITDPTPKPTPTPASSVSIQAPDGPVEEGASVELPVNLSLPVDGTVTVSWSTGGAEGTSQSRALSRSPPKHEHEPDFGTVTFRPGQTRAAITIHILDDEEHEDLESFLIVLNEVAVSSPDQVSLGRRTAKITITDDDAPPVLTEGGRASRSVAENTPPGTAIGAPIRATDAENDPLTYTLSGADANVFILDSTTGQLRTNGPLDFEARTNYGDLTVTVDDGHDHTDTLSLTVSVTDVDEPPAKPGAPTVLPVSSSATSELDVTWTAPNMTGKPAITDYDVRYRAAGAAEWSEHDFTGAGTRTTLTGLTAGTEYEVQILARNDEGDSPWSDTGAGSTPAPEPEAESEPTPETTPEPEPTPGPTPGPTPEPTPEAEPTPESTPGLTTEPKSEPTTLGPTPEPTTLGPTPEPMPGPTPEPMPGPTPETTAPEGAQGQGRTLGSTPEPTPEPTPGPSSGLASRPTSEPRPVATSTLTPEPAPQEPAPEPTPKVATLAYADKPEVSPPDPMANPTRTVNGHIGKDYFQYQVNKPNQVPSRQARAPP